MKYKAAIFDLDGTIMDTLEDLTDAVNYCLRKFGLRERTLAEIRTYLGDGARKLLEKAVPEGTDDALVEEVFQLFTEYYRKNCTIKSKPFDGICEAIAELRSAGLRTAVVSNKPDYAVQPLCEEFFGGLFDYVTGTREGVRIKPSPDMVYEALELFGVNPDEAVYIGDSEVDLMTAQNSKLDAIIVSWGFRDEEYLRKIGARTIVSTPLEMYQEIMK